MATVTALKTPKKVTTGSLIDDMSALRDQRRIIAKQDEELKAKYNEIETKLLERLDAEGMLKGTGRLASAGIGVSTQFDVVDWDAFMAYLIKSKQGHLVQRRVSAPAVLELYTAKGVVPGLAPFTKRVITLRNL